MTPRRPSITVPTPRADGHRRSAAPAPTLVTTRVYRENGARRIRLLSAADAEGSLPLPECLARHERVPSVACAVIVVDLSQLDRLDMATARCLVRGRRLLRAWGWRMCTTPPTLVDAHTLAWATREDAGSGTPVPWEFLPSAHPWVRCAGPAYDPWQTEQGSTRRSALVSSC